MSKKNFVLPLFFSIINLIVCNVVWTLSKNSLELYYNRSIYDVYIENVMKTDIGLQISGVYQAIMFSCLFIILLCLILYGVYKRKELSLRSCQMHRALLFILMMIPTFALSQYIQKIPLASFPGIAICDSDIGLYTFSARFYIFSCGVVIGAGAAQAVRERKKESTQVPSSENPLQKNQK